VPGQCAVLHVCSDRVDTARLRFWLNAVQTTSPSYMLMAAADYALQILWDNPQLFDEYLARLQQIESLDVTGANGIFAIDPSKILYRLPDVANAKAQNGIKLEEILACEYKLQVEMAYGQYVLLMTSVADTDEGFARLHRAVVGLDLQPPAPLSCIAHALPLPPEIVMPPRAAMQQPSQIIPAAQSFGRIAAELIAPCPPGIAVVVPGERITAHIPCKTIRVVAETSPATPCIPPAH